MKAVIYDENTGAIRRFVSGAVDPDRLVLGSEEALLTDEDASIPGNLKGKMVDPENGAVIDDPDYVPPDFSNPLGRQSAFLEAGADAIAARDAMDSNANIPQEVVDFADGMLRMNYLIYVHLAGDGERIESFEDRFFG